MRGWGALAEGVVMSGSGLCRVSVYADGVSADLALPDGVPIRMLIPAIIDALASHGAGLRDDPTAARYRLSDPATGVLDAAKTLAQQAIRDGTLLVLAADTGLDPGPRLDDVADAVAATAASPTPRTARLGAAAAASWLAGLGMLAQRCPHTAGGEHARTAAGIAAACAVTLLAAVFARRARGDTATGVLLSLLATGQGAAAGFVLVPGGPAAPNVMLAATAAGTVSLLALHVVGCGQATLTAVAGGAGWAAAAALGALVTHASLPAVGAVSAVAALGWLQLAARMSITAVGLSPAVPTLAAPPVPSERSHAAAIRGGGVLTGLIGAGSGAAAAGAVCTVVGVCAGVGPHRAGLGFAVLVGAVLLLRARWHADPVRAALSAVSGAAALSAVLVVTASPPGIFATSAALAVAASGRGGRAPAVPVSVQRGLEWLEYLALCALPALACWVCGLGDLIGGWIPW